MSAPIQTELLEGGLISFGRSPGVGTLILRPIEARLIAAFVQSAGRHESVIINRSRQEENLHLSTDADGTVSIATRWFAERAPQAVRGELFEVLNLAAHLASTHHQHLENDDRWRANRVLANRSRTYDERKAAA